MRGVRLAFPVVRVSNLPSHLPKIFPNDLRSFKHVSPCHPPHENNSSSPRLRQDLPLQCQERLPEIAADETWRLSHLPGLEMFESAIFPFEASSEWYGMISNKIEAFEDALPLRKFGSERQGFRIHRSPLLSRHSSSKADRQAPVVMHAVFYAECHLFDLISSLFPRSCFWEHVKFPTIQILAATAGSHMQVLTLRALEQIGASIVRVMLALLLGFELL